MCTSKTSDSQAVLCSAVCFLSISWNPVFTAITQKFWQNFSCIVSLMWQQQIIEMIHKHKSELLVQPACSPDLHSLQYLRSSQQCYENLKSLKDVTVLVGKYSPTDMVFHPKRLESMSSWLTVFWWNSKMHYVSDILYRWFWDFLLDWNNKRVKEFICYCTVMVCLFLCVTVLWWCVCSCVLLYCDSVFVLVCYCTVIMCLFLCVTVLRWCVCSCVLLYCDSVFVLCVTVLWVCLFLCVTVLWWCDGSCVLLYCESVFFLCVTVLW
jgi:hypothetical protein